MDLKHVLGQIDTYSRRLHGGRPFWLGWLMALSEPERRDAPHLGSVLAITECNRQPDAIPQHARTDLRARPQVIDGEARSRQQPRQIEEIGEYKRRQTHTLGKAVDRRSGINHGLAFGSQAWR